MGIKWNRGKLKVTSHDPFYTLKRERVEELKKKAKSGTLSSHDATDADKRLPPKPGRLVFFDSTDLHLCPDVGNGYAPRGEQIKVDSPGEENPWYALYGSLFYPTGEGLYTIHERKRHEEVQVHLELLIQGDPEAFWFVVLDNASSHTTGLLNSFREQYKQNMEFVYLPTYSPAFEPDRSPMASNARTGDTKPVLSKACPSEGWGLILQCEAVIEWLKKLSFAQFCSIMGINENDLIFV